MISDIIMAVLGICLLSDTLDRPARADTSALAVDDTLPKPIPDLLPADLFIPADSLAGALPWTSAPMAKPLFYIIEPMGFDGSIGFGEYDIRHPDKFFSTADGFNRIDIPQMYLSEQMFVGNTFRLGRNVYYLSGIMYGAQLGVMGNNWGMGTREGFIWHPSAIVTVILWTQYFRSVSVYSPVVMPMKDPYLKVIRMPATPEVFSFGLQATFVVGEFIIGVGTSVAPVPFQDRRHSRFRYR